MEVSLSAKLTLFMNLKMIGMSAPLAVLEQRNFYMKNACHIWMWKISLLQMR